MPDFLDRLYISYYQSHKQYSTPRIHSYDEIIFKNFTVKNIKKIIPDRNQ